jgi:hypothetical protein
MEGVNPLVAVHSLHGSTSFFSTQEALKDSYPVVLYLAVRRGASVG